MASLRDLLKGMYDEFSSGQRALGNAVGTALVTPFETRRLAQEQRTADLLAETGRLRQSRGLPANNYFNSAQRLTQNIANQQMNLGNRGVQARKDAVTGGARTAFNVLGAGAGAKTIAASAALGGTLGGGIAKLTGGNVSEGVGRGIGGSLKYAGLNRLTAPVIDPFVHASGKLGMLGGNVGRRGARAVAHGFANLGEDQLYTRLAEGRKPTKQENLMSFAIGAATSPLIKYDPEGSFIKIVDGKLKTNPEQYRNALGRYAKAEDISYKEAKAKVDKWIGEQNDFLNEEFPVINKATGETYYIKRKDAGFIKPDEFIPGVKPKSGFLRINEPEIGKQWKSDEMVARERFDLPKLKKLSGGGSDRDVYDLGDGLVLKVAKTARGLAQNASEGEPYAPVPKSLETGKNYVVVQKADPPNAKTKKIVKELKEVMDYNEYQPGNAAVQKLSAKYYELGDDDTAGMLSDLANYNLMHNDLISIRNWGSIDGEPVLLDAGTLNSRVLDDYKGVKNLNDPDFRDSYYQSKTAKKKFGDTDPNTMYGLAGGAYGFERDEEGNIVFNPEKAVYGMTLGLGVTKGAKYINKTKPQSTVGGVAEIAKKYGIDVQDASVVGSQAGGTAKQTSDFDLLITPSSEIKKKFPNFPQFASDAEYKQFGKLRQAIEADINKLYGTKQIHVEIGDIKTGRPSRPFSFEEITKWQRGGNLEPIKIYGEGDKLIGTRPQSTVGGIDRTKLTGKQLDVPSNVLTQRQGIKIQSPDQQSIKFSDLGGSASDQAILPIVKISRGKQTQGRLASRIHPGESAPNANQNIEMQSGLTSTKSSTQTLDPSKQIIPPGLISADDAPIVKSNTGKVHILDIFRTPDRVLGKLGLGKEAEMIRKQWTGHKQQLPKELDKVNGWYQRVGKSDEASQRLFKYLDGDKSVKLNQTELEVAGEIQGYLKQWADRLGLPEEKRIKNYITHIFEKDLIEKDFDPELAKIIRDKIPGEVYDPFLQERLGKLGYVEDAFRALDAYVKRAVRKEYMDPALDNMKMKAGRTLDESYLDAQSWDYVKNYIDRVNFRPTWIDEMVDEAVKQSPIGYKFGSRPVSTVSRAIRRMVYRGTLGLNVGSAMKNLTQGTNTYAELGEKYTGLGYIKALKNMNGDELKRVGVLEDSFIDDRYISGHKKMMEKIDSGLFAFFNAAEKINRGAAYFGAKQRALDAGKSMDEAIQAGINTARKTQFTFGQVDTPVALQSDIAKLALQFQSFNIKQGEFLGEKIQNKEWAGLLRWLGLNAVIIYGASDLFGIEKLSDLIPTVKVGESPFFELAGSVKDAVTDSPDEYGNDMDAVDHIKNIGTNLVPFIPAGSQIKKTKEGLQAVGQGASTSKSGRVRFPVITNSLPEKIKVGALGQYRAKEAYEYFDKNRSTLGDKQSAKYLDLFQKDPDAAVQYYKSVIEKREADDEPSGGIINTIQELIRPSNQVGAAEEISQLPEDKEELYALYKSALSTTNNYKLRTNKVKLGLSDTDQQDIEDDLTQAVNLIQQIKKQNPDIGNRDDAKKEKPLVDAQYSLATDRLKRDKDVEGWIEATSTHIDYLKKYQKGLDKKKDAKEIITVQNKIEDLQVQLDKYKGYGGFTKGKKKSGIKIAKPKTKKALKLSTNVPTPRTIGYPKISAPKVKPFNIAKINTQIGTNKINTSIKKPGKLKVSFA